jgi:hypothetical protein
MTNDFAVTQQQKKSPVWPTVGAIAGGVGGYYAARGKYATHDDIIKEAHDIPDIKAQTDSELWQAVLDKETSVKEWDQKLADASKAKLDEKSTEAKELAQAKKDLQDAVTRKQAVENGAKTGSKVVTGTTSKIVPYSTDWRMTPAEAAEYQTWYADFQAAEAAYEARPEVDNLKTAISDRQNLIDDVFTDVKADEVAMIDKTGGTKHNPKPKNFSEYVNNYSEEAFQTSLRNRDVVKLADGEIIKLAGGEGALSATAVTAPKRGAVIPVVKKDGSTAYAVLDAKTFREYEKMLDQRIESVAKKLANNYTRYSEILELAEDESKMEKLLKFDKGLIRNAGTTREKAVTDIKTWLADAPQYAADMRAIERAKLTNFVPDGARTFSDPAVEAIMTTYGVASPKEAYQMLSARTGMINKYNSVTEGLVKEAETMFADCDRELARLTKELETSRAKDKALTTAESKIKGKYKEFLKVEKTTTTGAKAGGDTKKLQETIDRLQKVVEDKQKLYDAAAGKGGAIDEAAKKAAEEGRNAAKKELDEAVNKLINKVGRKGGKPILGAAIGVAAGAGLLWAIAPKKSNNA